MVFLSFVLIFRIIFKILQWPFVFVFIHLSGVAEANSVTCLGFSVKMLVSVCGALFFVYSAIVAITANPVPLFISYKPLLLQI